MLNPFVHFTKRMLLHFRDIGRRYLVSQTNVQAMPQYDGEIYPLLLTDYDDPGLAQIHLKALEDRYAAIIDLKNEKHFERIKQLLEPGSGYRVYGAFIESRKQVERSLDEKYTENIRNYITSQTTWRIGADRKINPKLEMIFGELFVTLKYGSQRIRIKLAELEKY